MGRKRCGTRGKPRRRDDPSAQCTELQEQGGGATSRSFLFRAPRSACAALGARMQRERGWCRHIRELVESRYLHSRQSLWRPLNSTVRPASAFSAGAFHGRQATKGWKITSSNRAAALKRRKLPRAPEAARSGPPRTFMRLQDQRRQQRSMARELLTLQAQLAARSKAHFNMCPGRARQLDSLKKRSLEPPDWLKRAVIPEISNAR